MQTELFRAASLRRSVCRTMSVTLVGTCLAATSLADLGCSLKEREQALDEPKIGQGGGRGVVVSRVGTIAITAEELELHMRISGLSLREALQELQSEALLVAEATNVGFDHADSVFRAFRQAQVHELLRRDVEQQITPAASSEESQDELTQARFRRLVALLQSLRQRVRPVRNEPTIRSAVARVGVETEF